MSAINFIDYFYRKINGVKRVQFDAYLERQSGEGTYLFANGLPIGMATPGDCQGIKMEFDYGVTPTLTTGKMAHGLDIKMTMDQAWDTDTKPYNCTVRGARIQAWSEDNISGRLTGAYINARAEGDAEIEGYISGATGPGIIGIQARTELGTSATITSPAAVGLMIFHYSKASSVLTGFYRGLQIEVPLMGSAASISTTTCAMYVGNDWGGGDTFDYGLYIKTGTCDRALYAACSTGTGSTHVKVVDINVTDATTTASGYNASFFVEVTNTGAMTPTEYSAARFNLILSTGTKTGLMVGLKAKVGKTGSPTLTSADPIGIEVSMDELGTTSSYSCLWLETYQTTTIDTSFFIWCKSQGQAQLDAVIGVWGNKNPVFFLRTQGFQAGFFDQGGVAGDQCIGHIACEFASTTGYINVYSDNS